MRTWIISHISTIHCVQVCQLGSPGTWGQQLGVKYSQQLASLNCTVDIGQCIIGRVEGGKSQQNFSKVWKRAQFGQNNFIVAWNPGIDYILKCNVLFFICIFLKFGMSRVQWQDDGEVVINASWSEKCNPDAVSLVAAVSIRAWNEGCRGLREVLQW